MPKVGDIVRAKEIGYKGLGKYIWTACSDCGKERWNKYIKVGTNQNFCHSCWQKKSRNSNWKGGIVDNGHGYLTYRIPEDHRFYCMKNLNDAVLLHRLIMAEHLGRPLKEKEIVHHVNGNIKDNRIENLMLLSWIGEHTKLHHENGTFPKKLISKKEYAKKYRQEHKEYFKEYNKQRYRKKKDKIIALGE